MNVKVAAALIVLLLVISGFVYVGLGSMGLIEVPGIPHTPGEPIIIINTDVRSTYDFTNFTYEYFPEGTLSFDFPKLYWRTFELEIVGELYDPKDNHYVNVTKFIGRIDSSGVDVPVELIFGSFNTENSEFTVTLKIFSHPNPYSRVKKQEMDWDIEI